ncbi:MAG TPA: phosphatase PAP2 family protein [Tepidisphaeraceae bacterium]|nr:phosphatase PAP2 family protein [Tepidisphaeraceae bacterium]
MIWLWWLIPGLLVASGALMLVERSGARTTLFLPFKGDVKRETRFLAQWGQFVCTAICTTLVLQLDPSRANKGRMVPTVVAVMLASAASNLIKRLVGRVRPGRPGAGQFLGPSWKHANYRESFPSSHTACAAALSAGLAWIYPQAAATFWTLAVACGLLRYLMDAHWPSDVLGGFALGYGCAGICWWFFVILHPYW